MLRRVAPVLASLLLCIGGFAVACKRSEKTSAPDATIRLTDAGAELVSGERVAPIPAGDLAPGSPTVLADDAGKRFAYASGAGEARLVYVVGDSAFLGQKVPAPVDFDKAPILEAALGGLLVNAGPRAEHLVSAVSADLGEAGLVRMLVDGAGTSAPAWDSTFAKLSPPRKEEVKAALAKRLEPGQPEIGLLRAVVLAEPPEASALASRARELVRPLREPRALAVLVRALAKRNEREAAGLGCEVLAVKPLAPAEGSAEEIDRPGREALVEAALLAIAAGKGDCEHVQPALLGDDLCLPLFRCGPAGPLTGQESSRQDEPLCDDDALIRGVPRELARPASEIVSLSHPVRPELWAFTVLAGRGKLPPELVKAHERRRYALVQPKGPSCDDVPPGTPCHCDEAVVRDFTCRHPESSTVSVGLCKWSVDDAKKKLTNVVATPPP